MPAAESTSPKISSHGQQWTEWLLLSPFGTDIFQAPRLNGLPACLLTARIWDASERSPQLTNNQREGEIGTGPEHEDGRQDLETMAWGKSNTGLWETGLESDYRACDWEITQGPSPPLGLTQDWLGRRETLTGCLHMRVRREERDGKSRRPCGLDRYGQKPQGRPWWKHRSLFLLLSRPLQTWNSEPQTRPD